jgi:hypothetical protein
MVKLKATATRSTMVEPPPQPRPAYPVLSVPMDVKMHECSMCGYISIHKHHTQRHVGTQCPGAAVLSGDVTVYPGPQAPGPPAPQGDTLAITGDHNTAVTGDHNSVVTIINIIPVGTDGESQALHLVFQNKANLQMLSECEPCEIPAAVLRLTKGMNVPPGIRNVKVEGDKVRETRPNGVETLVPRSKYVRQTTSEMTKACARAMPEYTADPGTMQLIHDKMQTRRYKLGKRAMVSPGDVAEMIATSDHKNLTKLDGPGRVFMRDVQTNLNNEVDYLV